MSEKNDNSKGRKSVDDPLDELNELDDKVPTIEPENDIFEELEIRDAESIPEYNGDSSSIIKHDPIDDIIDEKEKTVKATKQAQEVKRTESEINQMKEVINELESSETINEQHDIKSEIKDTKLAESSTAVKQEKTLKENKSSNKKAKRLVPKPKAKSNRKQSSKVKKIDDVKVDEDGVPLLNQFDTDRIRNNSFYNKLHLSKRNMTQLIMVIVGFLILIYGVLQSFNDMVKISDNVLYGEQASMAIAIMFLGILIIVLSFYKEIITLLGIGGLYSNMDSSDSDTIDEYDDSK